MKSETDILSNEIHPDPFYTIQDVAEIFACSTSTVKNWIKDGKLKTVIIGGGIDEGIETKKRRKGLLRITRDELIRFGKGRDE